MIHSRLQLLQRVSRYCLQESLFGIILLKHEGMQKSYGETEGGSGVMSGIVRMNRRLCGILHTIMCIS